MTHYLPVELAGPGFAVVRGYADSESVRVLIDTGDFAPYAVLITPDLAARLKLKPRSRTRCVHAPLGSRSICFTPVSMPFRLGPVRAAGDDAGISPQVGEIAARFGGSFDAVVGGRFLKSRRLTIDYRQHLLTFDGPVPRMPSMTFRTLSVSAVVGNATVNGAAPFRFLIDTAAADTIVTPWAARRTHILAGGPTPLYAAGGAVTVATGSNARICLGTRCRSGLTVKIAHLPRKIELLGTSIDGVVGVPFLASGKLTIDYPAHRLWLEP